MELGLVYPRSVFSWDVPVVKVRNYLQLVGNSCYPEPSGYPAWTSVDISATRHF